MAVALTSPADTVATGTPRPVDPTLVLVRMKLRLARNLRRGDRAFWSGTGALLGAALAVGTIVLAVGWPHLLPAAYAAWALGWVVGPVLTGGGDETLRPELFAAVGLPPRTLATGLLVAAFAGIAPAVAAIAALSLVVHGALLGVGPALVAVPTAALSLVLLVLVSRVSVGVFGLLLRSRSGAVVAGAATGVVLALSAQGWWLTIPLARRRHHRPGRRPARAAVRLAARRRRRLPRPRRARLGRDAGARRGADAGLGRAADPAVRCRPTAVAAGRPPRAGPHPARRGARQGAADLSRDVVRINLLAFSATYGLVVCALPLAAGVTTALPFAGAAAVVMATGTTANLYGSDGTALWLTLLTPGAERVDVRGRQIAWLTAVGPAAVLLTVALTWGSGESWAWPFVLALLPALLGGGAGLVVLFSVVAAVPGTDPHLRAGNPLSWSDDDGAQVGLVMVMIVLAPVVAGPAFGLALAGTLLESAPLARAGVPVGLATGAVCAHLLGRVAIDRLTARGPELLSVLRHGRPALARFWTAAGSPPDMPRWATTLTAVFWIAGWIPLFPQGIVAAVLLLVEPSTRSWFLALHLDGAWQWATILAMITLGLAMLLTAWLLPRRYARPTS